MKRIRENGNSSKKKKGIYERTDRNSLRNLINQTKNIIHIVDNVYESDWYKNDVSFDQEESDRAAEEDLKNEYYLGDAWYDCDYILRKGKKTIGCIKVNDEIILKQGFDEEEEPLSKKEKEAIITFYDDDLLTAKMYGTALKKSSNEEFVEQSTWPDSIEESNKNMNNAKLAIKYRGGQGYHYGWWILIK